MQELDEVLISEERLADGSLSVGLGHYLTLKRGDPSAQHTRMESRMLGGLFVVHPAGQLIVHLLVGIL